MRILEVNTVFQFGSTGKIVRDLKNTLEQNGHEVTVACGRPVDNKVDNVYVVGNKLQSGFDAIGARLFDNAGFGTISPTDKIISLIEKQKPDIVHLHNIHGYYVNIQRLFDYLKKTNQNVVWTLHDCWPFTGHCTYFEYSRCEKWKKMCEHCVQKTKYPKSVLMDASKRNYEKKKELFTGLENLIIVTPSDWLNSLVKESFLNAYDVVTINNGIDLNTFHPMSSELRKKYGLETSVVLLAVASIWGERKGFSNYIRLAGMLPQEFKIVMVGVDDKQQSLLPPNIIGIKRTSSTKELAEWYSTADVFLLLTEEDNFPTVSIESLACGLPIIANKVGGATEAFDSFTGIGVDTNDMERIANLLKKKEYTRFSREKCLERAKQFEKESCYSKYEELFVKIIRRQNA